MANPLPILSLVPALAVAGWVAVSPSPGRTETPVGGEGVNAQALQRLVHQDCGSCHGMTLKGGLGPDIRPQSLTHYDPETLETVILDGVPGTAMPPWRPLLTREEARWIALYLLTGDAK